MILKDINMIAYKDTLYKIIGNKIKSLREDLKISQHELSQRLDISRSSISNIEVGRHQVPLHLLYEISNVFQTDIKSLLPTFEDITSYMNQEINDYSPFLESTALEDEQIKNISAIIKNIQP